jgi:hypothetical protein
MSFLQKVKSGWAALSIDCRLASRAQSEQFDRPLSRSERMGLRLHLFFCKWCRRYGRQLNFLHCAAHERHEKLAETSLKRLSDEARERMKRRLQTEKKL